MNSFSRIITLLRKEKGITQKQAAADLGISQALLSHYEKGLRECGLDFLIKLCDYYNVSSDYILGRSPDRSGAVLTVDDLEGAETVKDSHYSGSVLPAMNKRLISSSLNVVYDMLAKAGSKELTTKVSYYLMLSVYRVFRKLSRAEKKKGTITKYKEWGLILFVAIPFPGTGGWAGALIAALMDLRFKKCLPIIALGVFIAGLIMSLVTYGFFG